MTKEKDLIKRMLSSLTEEERKEVMEELAPKEEFDYRSIKTIEDALRRNKRDVYYFVMRIDETSDEWAYRMLKEVIKAINDDPLFPNVQDNNQKKWYPYFQVLSSGSGFSDTHCHCEHTATSVGSRLVFKDKERAEYAVKQFVDLYKKFLL